MTLILSGWTADKVRDPEGAVTVFAPVRDETGYTFVPSVAKIGRGGVPPGLVDDFDVARRIVACVNALSDVSTEELERSSTAVPMGEIEYELQRRRQAEPPPPPPPEKDPGVSASAGSKSFEFLRCRHGVRSHRAALLLCPLAWPVLVLVGVIMLVVWLLEELLERRKDA